MAIVRGDNRDNTLVGTRDADFISGRSGDDHLFGRGGDDTLDGGPGDDTFDGGPGRDTLTFAKLQGDEGVFISAFLSGDFVGRQITFPEDFSLLTSIEAIVGSENDDTIPGDVGRDELRGGGGQDRLDGLGGSDRIRGGPGADIIFGDDPNDATGLFGPEGNDRLLGEDGNDQLFGSGGRDEIRGGSGFDILDGNAGDDVLIGGVGPDIFRFRLIDRLDEFEPVAGDGTPRTKARRGVPRSSSLASGTTSCSAPAESSALTIGWWCSASPGSPWTTWRRSRSNRYRAC
jgi:Ca2+-binding RTX toxin-like protein